MKPTLRLKIEYLRSSLCYPCKHMHGRQLHICRYAVHVGCGFLCPGIHGLPTLICPILLGALRRTTDLHRRQLILAGM